MENNIFDMALTRGLKEIINEQQRTFLSNLRRELLTLIESKKDEKIIIKELVDLIDEKFNLTYYDPRGW